MLLKNKLKKKFLKYIKEEEKEDEEGDVNDGDTTIGIDYIELLTAYIPVLLLVYFIIILYTCSSLWIIINVIT